MTLFDSIQQEIEVLPGHHFFYPRACALISRNVLSQRAPRTQKEEIIQICLNEFDDISRRLDRTKVQDSASCRNVIKARRLAEKIIGDDGEIKIEILDYAIEGMRSFLYSLSPGRDSDAVRDVHILNALILLKENKELAKIFKSISRPYSNRLAEEIIRHTLTVPPNVPITDVHVRRACLSCWLTFLRQSLGSCFATAPSIMVQQEMPHLFLRDLDEMMNTGYLRRTYAGVEHSVPLSYTWGNGDLMRPIFLHRDLHHNENTIWMAPSFILPLEAIGMIDQNLSWKDKAHVVRNLMEKGLQVLEKNARMFFTNADELFTGMLLSKFGLNQKEVTEFLNRPKGLLQTSLVMTAPQGLQGTGKKAENIQSYLKALDQVRDEFKGLQDNALLKSWEFTVASFSEINLNFTRWNLYSSLGLNSDDPGGIGECLYKIISMKVDQANLKLKELQEECEQVEIQMKYLEGRMQQASTEKEISWIKMEHQSRQTELYHIDQVRKTAYEKASKIGGLLAFLQEEYDKKFFDYFQEVYDADIHEVTTGPFDDSPAGFRLIYKHGRTNPSLWSPIRSLQDYIDSLASFFTATERDLSSMPQVQGIEQEFTIIITQLVNHVRSDEFQETSFYRMAKAHNVPLVRKPLQNLDKVEKKPWVYTSGGSMSTLVSAYFRRAEKPTEVERWVENEVELCAFLIDSIKQLPPKSSEVFLKYPNKSLLMHSPTHAFLLKPGFEKYKEGWTSDQYTYSWIKHEYMEPITRFYEMYYLDQEVMRDVIDKVYHTIPIDFRPRFMQIFQTLPYRLSIREFHDYFFSSVHQDRGLKGPFGQVVSIEEIDNVLFSELPYTTPERALEFMTNFLVEEFSNMPQIKSNVDETVYNLQKILQLKRVVSSQRLLETTKGAVALCLGLTRSKSDIHKKIIEKMRAERLKSPLPLIFADTNWVKDYFAFVVNPASKDLEFWTVDYYGVQGRPLSHWKMWMNGSKREPKWGVFPKAMEYVS